MTVSWGILSTARINREILGAAEESDQVDVIGVASRDGARAEAYAREHGIERAYGSYEALLEDTEIEAIYISLPNGMHIDWTMRALEAGKHVLCEKPLSRRSDDVVLAFDYAESAGLVLSEAFMWRHHPQAKKLAQLLDEGTIGRLRLVRASFSFQLATRHGPNDTRFDPQLDGGALMDVGCYCISMIRYVAGEPQRVEAEQVLGESGVDVVFAAALRLPGETLAHYDCGFVLPSRDEVELVGEGASLFLDDPWHARSPVIELRRDGEVEPVEAERANSYRLELENVAAAIRGEAPLLLGRDDAVGQARAIEALYRSASEAAPVELVTEESRA
jgi:D-xylose 1-dehydrogenase (NADP+, D-xylono-1,5-lactone-forming)